MTRSRESLISLEATPYYHCVTRCVRKAYLCGKDADTGHNFEHRHQWLVDRFEQLTAIYAIDIAAYAVMHNHYHLVLFIDREMAESWSEAEVIERWHKLFKGSSLSQRFLTNEKLSEAELDKLFEQVEEWRSRLMSISWLMRCLNESIARRANEEEDCKGRFWEGRFKSQALLDEKALAACMAYVDLNPIRAKIAKTPETSTHTSVQRRIQKAQTTTMPNRQNQQPQQLQPFVGNPRKNMPKGLPFKLSDYLELLDWSGRLIRENKRGAIPADLPPILDRLDLDAKQWRYLTTSFESRFKTVVGTGHNIRKACESLGIAWVHGARQCRALFG